MRIVIAGLNGGSNGIETYTRLLVASLLDRGHDVWVTVRSADVDVPAGATAVRRLSSPMRHLVLEISE